jgi:hypothetical protein
MIIVGEIAGRDSIAAIIKAVEELKNIRGILPVVTKVPTEEYERDTIFYALKFLRRRIKELYKDKVRVLDYIEYSDHDLWRELSIKNIGYLASEYSFYTPCVGCHLYLHIMRAKIALDYDAIVVSGERHSHDGRVKLNQTEEAIEVYRNVLSKMGVELLTPLSGIEESSDIISLLGSRWDEGENQAKCHLSGNYPVDINKNNYTRYLNEYIYKTGIKILEDD